MSVDIKVQILAQDINENKYLDASKCPITKALQRAGFNYFHNGFYIVNAEDNRFINVSDKQLKELTMKVKGMYSTKDNQDYFEVSTEVKKLPITDFEFILKII